MRGIWQQAPRPKLSFGSASRTSIRSRFARRTTAANGGGNKIAACDVFAVFLAPLLAAAAFADTSWKESKRKEWQRRINEINEEVEQLRAREVEVWARIQYRSVRHGIMQQRRLYSTGAAAAAHEVEPINWGEERQPDVPLYGSIGAPPTSFHLDPNADMPRPTEELPSAPKMQYEALIMRRLVLRLLLNSYSGGDPKYASRYQNYIAKNILPEEIGNVVVHLDKVSEDLKNLAHTRLDRRAMVGGVAAYAEHLVSRQYLSELRAQYQDKLINRQELVDKVCEWLMDHHNPPAGAFVYTELIILFTSCLLDDLAACVATSFRDTGYVLMSADVASMIEYSAMTRNAKAFDWLIHELTSKESLVRVAARPWQWWKRDGVLVVGPTNFNPFMYKALIRACLHFGAEQRASAYYDIAQEHSWNAKIKGFVVKHFLQYHATNSDWSRSWRWVNETLQYLQDESILLQFNSNIGELGDAFRAIGLRLADLFLACSMNDEFTEWLEIIVDTGISPPNMHLRAQPRWDSLQWTLDQWRSCHDKQSPASFTAHSLLAFQARLKNFSRKIEDVKPTLAQSLEDKADSVTGTADSTDYLVPSTAAVPALGAFVTLDPPTQSNAEEPLAQGSQSKNDGMTNMDYSRVMDLINSERARSEELHEQQRNMIRSENEKARTLSETRHREHIALLRQQQEEVRKRDDERIRALEEELQSLKAANAKDVNNDIGTATAPASPPAEVVPEKKRGGRKRRIRAMLHAAALARNKPQQAQPQQNADGSDEDSGYDSAEETATPSKTASKNPMIPQVKVYKFADRPANAPFVRLDFTTFLPSTEDEPPKPSQRFNIDLFEDDIRVRNPSNILTIPMDKQLQAGNSNDPTISYYMSANKPGPFPDVLRLKPAYAQAKLKIGQRRVPDHVKWEDHEEYHSMEDQEDGASRPNAYLLGEGQHRGHESG